MITNYPLAAPEDIIDLALILAKSEAKMNLARVADYLLEHCKFRTTASTLSKVRSVKREGRWFTRVPSTGMPTEKIQLKNGLIVLLAQTCGIQFDPVRMVFFRQHETGAEEVWGRIVPDNGARPSEKKRQVKLPDFEVSASLSHLELYGKVQHAQEVRILHTYLSDIGGLMSNLERAVNNNPHCKIRILLLEPFGEAMLLRMKGLSQKTTEQIVSTAIENYQRLIEIAQKLSRNVEFRTYNELTGNSFFQIDDTIYTAFLLYQRFSLEVPYLVMTNRGNNPLMEALEGHFDRLWGDAVDKHFDLSYDCYVMRSGKVENWPLGINSATNEVCMRSRIEGVKFQGSIIEMQGGNAHLFLQTCFSSAQPSLKDRRTATFLVSLQGGRLKDRRLALAEYLLESAEGQILSNVVILENRDFASDLSEGEKLNLATRYLSRNPSANQDTEIQLDSNIFNWEHIRRALKNG